MRPPTPKFATSHGSRPGGLRAAPLDVAGETLAERVSGEHRYNRGAGKAGKSYSIVHEPVEALADELPFGPLFSLRSFRSGQVVPATF